MHQNLEVEWVLLSSAKFNVRVSMIVHIHFACTRVFLVVSCCQHTFTTFSFSPYQPPPTHTRARTRVEHCMTTSVSPSTVKLTDVDGDGKPELLASTNTANGKGAVFAFEIPANPKSDSFTKHVLATGYKPTLPFLPGRGSPGTAIAFKPTSSAKSPSIIVSADDGGWVDLLTPTGTRFEFSKQRIINGTGTIGSPAIDDVNGDGYADMAVPMYADGTVGFYTWSS